MESHWSLFLVGGTNNSKGNVLASSLWVINQSIAWQQQLHCNVSIWEHFFQLEIKEFPSMNHLHQDSLTNKSLKLKILENPSMLVSSPILPSIQPIGNEILLNLHSHCSSHSCYQFLFRWVFEKYDGIRGFWNPLKKAMFSRSGSRFDLPQEVIDDMPSDLFLDGELWYSVTLVLP